jgi:hypothetical protein
MAGRNAGHFCMDGRERSFGAHGQQRMDRQRNRRF